MAKNPEFAPTETPRGWMISIPAAMTASGKRVRKYFSSPSAAAKFGASMRSAHGQGIRGGIIPAALAMQAAEANRILDGTGISLVEAARMAVARAGDNASPEMFRERLRRATAANEGRWSDRYELDIGKIPKWVPKWFLLAKCSTIDRSEVERALTDGKKLARSTIDARSSRILAVLNYRERHRKSSEIEILSPAECDTLLAACESKTERYAVALLLFAGIRPDAEHGEITRLDWSDIGKTEIYVSREASKVSDRHIPITARLRRLIKGHPKDGPVIPANWKRVWTRIRKSAGITAQDVCRHTFASNFLAAFGSDKAKQAMGHTKGSDTLFRHYRRAVTEEDGKKHFR